MPPAAAWQWLGGSIQGSSSQQLTAAQELAEAITDPLPAAVSG
jgi:hypothetical protein